MDIFNIILNGPTQYCHGINGVNISYFWNAWLNHTVHPASVGLLHIWPKFVYRSTYVAALTDTVIDVLVSQIVTTFFDHNLNLQSLNRNAQSCHIDTKKTSIPYFETLFADYFTHSSRIWAFWLPTYTRIFLSNFGRIWSNHQWNHL